MDKWFDSKWFVRVISLVFACLLYYFVDMDITPQLSETRVPGAVEQTEVLNDVPVNIRIDSDRYVVSGVPEFVTVSLDGANSVLTPTIRQRNFEVYVDLEELGEGTHTVDLEYTKVPSELSVFIEPKTIEVEIEERASEDFPVSVDFINKDQLPEGYELSEVVVNPEQVTITSSRSVIDQIAIVQVYIDVAGLTESVNNREIPVNVYDSSGNVLNARVEPESVVVSVNVDNPSKEVPVEILTTGELPEGYELISIDPKVEHVEIYGTSEALEETNEVSTVEVDLSKVNKTGTIDVELDLPEGLKSSEETVEVDVKIEQKTEENTESNTEDNTEEKTEKKVEKSVEKKTADKTTDKTTEETEDKKTIDDVPIDLESDEGQNVSFITPTAPLMSITVEGSEKNVSKVKANDFQISIDLKGLSEGEHDVPLSIDGPDNVEYSSEYEQVTVDIT
ncbi:MAG TPA: CdaR family protein [Virgibacillus sp.]|nr:CdaR family protein [Virgibacillus sp.]